MKRVQNERARVTSQSHEPASVCSEQNGRRWGILSAMVVFGEGRERERGSGRVRNLKALELEKMNVVAEITTLHGPPQPQPNLPRPKSKSRSALASDHQLHQQRWQDPLPRRLTRNHPTLAQPATPTLPPVLVLDLRFEKSPLAAMVRRQRSRTAHSAFPAPSSLRRRHSQVTPTCTNSTCQIAA